MLQHTNPKSANLCMIFPRNSELNSKNYIRRTEWMKVNNQNPDNSFIFKAKNQDPN